VFQIELSGSQKYLILFKTGITAFYKLHMHNVIPGPGIKLCAEDPFVFSVTLQKQEENLLHIVSDCINRKTLLV
jgi:hypothetical protein